MEQAMNPAQVSDSFGVVEATHQAAFPLSCHTKSRAGG